MTNDYEKFLAKISFVEDSFIMSFSNLFGIFPNQKKEMIDPLSPPLPLLKFESFAVNKTGPITVTGEALKSIPNKLEGWYGSKGERIFDPIQAKKLARWFVARSQREVNYKQMEAYTKHFQQTGSDEQKIDLFDYVIYESLLYVETKAERAERNSRRPTELQVHLNRQQERLNEELESNTVRRNYSTNSLASSSGDEGGGAVKNLRVSSPPSFTPSIIFDSEFESGNLEKATRVIGRETIINDRALEHIGDYAIPTDVDQEYDLTLRNDINTDGNIQWYYYSVKVDKVIDGNPVNFPLKVRFNIINMQKKDSLYNYGMRPAIYSTKDGLEKDWFNGGYDICYYKNGLTTCKTGKKKMSLRNQYTFTFSYTFDHPDTVYFAYTFPYTYSDLQRFLMRLEADPIASNYLHRRSLCNTLAGNRCDVLTITERTVGAVESKYKPGIIISGRIHPGESNSSFVVHGLIEFLCSEAPEASKLRKSFIFTIVPMLNVDGVIHGNYRCSLAGTDLNRRFMDCHPSLHPVIVAFKELIKTIQNNRSIALFLDLHGHSKLKNSFIYGCDLTLQPDKYAKYVTTNLSDEEVNHRRIFCRIFPKILCTLSKSTNPNGYFSYRDCSFKIDKSKFGTGRVVSWRDLGVLAAYTIEISFCGNGDNSEKKTLRKYFDGSSGGGTSTCPSPLKTSRNTSAKVPKKKKTKKLRRRKSKLITSINEGEIAFNNGIADDSNGGDDMGNNEDEIIDEDDEDNDNENDEIEPINANVSSRTNNSKGGTLPLDSNLLTLLDSYRTASHYQKTDLLIMGRQICQSIYHFANLTHADLEYEKEFTLQYDRDLKEKKRKEEVDKQLTMKYPISSSSATSVSTTNNAAGANITTKSQGGTPTITCTSPITTGRKQNPSQQSNLPSPDFDIGKPSTTEPVVDVEAVQQDEEEIDYYKQALETLYGPNTSDAISRLTVNSNSNGTSSPLLVLGESESGKYNARFAGSAETFNNSNVGIASSPRKSRQVNQLIGDDPDNCKNFDNFLDDVDAVNDLGDEENSDGESEGSTGNNPQGENEDTQGDTSNPNEKVNNMNISSSNTAGGVNLTRFFSTYMDTSVETFESNMAIRILNKNGVFNLPAIQTLIQSYPQEFFVEKSTQNIGFRLKCELAIRKLLKLDDKIDAQLAALASSSNNPYLSNLLEEEADSGDESESNPSVDNQPTSKLLKSMSEGAYNLSVVNALKQAIRKRKHKEMLLKKKREKKLAYKLMKQAELARKIALENERKEREDRLKQRPYSASSLKIDPRRRRGSIHSSLPKFAPTYRMAPTEPKINVPVQIKLVNFKDFDRRGKLNQQPSSWSQINTVFYDDDPVQTTYNASTYNGGNVFPAYDPKPPEPNPLLQQNSKLGRSSVYLNSSYNRNGGGSLSGSLDVPQHYWVPNRPATTSAVTPVNLPQDAITPATNNHNQILVSSDTTNTANRLSGADRMNDAHIVYAPAVDLSPIIPKTMLSSNSSPTSMRRPVTVAYKDVSLDITNAESPSVVNLKRLAPMTTNNYPPDNMIADTPNSQQPTVEQTLLKPYLFQNSPDKASPRVQGKGRKSSVAI